MSRKQSGYLSGLIGVDADPADDVAPPRAPASNVLANRAQTLGRVINGDISSVTQVRVDPAVCRIWPGNARVYADLNYEACASLIDAIISEGGQKFPATLRAVKDDPNFEYEVIAGTRRHWAISWLRNHHYPDMRFVGQVVHLDDEAAFRLADIENRERDDVSVVERARNYAHALRTYYNGQQSNMAKRLNLDAPYVSKIISVSEIPDEILAAFSNLKELNAHNAYSLARAIAEDAVRNHAIAAAPIIADEQSSRKQASLPPLPVPTVMARLLRQPQENKASQPTSIVSRLGKTLLKIHPVKKGIMRLDLYLKAGAGEEEIKSAIAQAIGLSSGE